MKSKFPKRNLICLHLVVLSNVMCAVQSESNRMTAENFNYPKSLLFFTIMCSWWPKHSFAISQIDSDVMNFIVAGDNENILHLHQTPSIGLHSMGSSSNLNSQHFAILELRSKIDRQLKSMNERELLAPAIQHLFDIIESTPLAAIQNDTKMLSQMSAKIEAKLSKAIETVNETSGKIMDIIAWAESMETKTQPHRNAYEQRILLETIIFPCTADASTIVYDAAPELDDNKSIEILNYLNHAAGHLHETSDKNFTTNSRIMDEIKWIHTQTSAPAPDSIIFRDAFFLAKDNYGSVSNCRRYFPNEEYQRLLLSHIKSKRLIMIVDNGAFATNDEFDKAKTLATNIINLLGDDDRVIIIGAAGEIIARQSKPSIMDNSNNKQNSQFHRATREMKQNFVEFVHTLNKTNASTNHSMVFAYAFEWIRNASKSALMERSPVLMFYISRGLVTAMTDTKNVLETIAFGQSRLAQPVVISTCAIILEEQRSMHDQQFLADISDQNYSKYNIELPSSGHDRFWHKKLLSYQKGKSYTIAKRNTNDISLIAIAVLVDIWYGNDNLKHSIQFHRPVYDSSAKDHILSITKSCSDRAVVGIGLYLTELIEDFLYYFNKYADSDESYAFLVDLNGTTISHPSFSRPQLELTDEVYPTDIRYLEKMNDDVWQRLRHETNGNATIISSERLRKIYTWQRISHHFIGCLVRVWSQAQVIVNRNLLPASQMHYDAEHNSKRPDESRSDLIFHRLDLVRSEVNQRKLCNYFKQLSIHDKITLFLSAGAFKSPFLNMRSMCPTHHTADVMREQCAQGIESIMAYIRDTTNLLTNPGLHAHIRSDILQLLQAMELLRARHDSDDAEFSPYIIRRYMTSMNGMMLMYPGAVLPNDFEPSKRIWFRKAVENFGKLVVTTPYLDAGGAGYIVTMSHAIQVNAKPLHHGRPERHEKQRRRRRQHHANDEYQKLIAIVSVDLARGFFYHLLMQSSDYCQNGVNIKCFLIDDMGYLIAHPSILEALVQSNSAGDVDIHAMRRSIVDHITHKESFIANDILLHRNLVEKRLCQNLRSRKIQRFYLFNTSIVDVLGNVVNGERSKYVVTTIPNTNLLVIMLNSTEGDGSAAFCPCSTVDRICFNCNRIELMNCECPCECPLKSLNMQSTIKEYPNGELLGGADEEIAEQEINLFEKVDICPAPIEEYHPLKKSENNPTAILDGLGACVKYSCEQYANQFDCLGILGCEWCQIEIDAETLLSPAFCTHQSVCFGGILGSATPYGDGDLGTVVIESVLPSAYAAIGPVVGATVVLCFIIAIAMYSYRNNLEPGSEQLYVESIPFENNIGLPLSRLDYESAVPNDAEKRNHIPRAGFSDISPYRMHAGNFRRPNGESDHGYSTMTPHDDSDHACFTLIEPLINSKKMSNSDSTSINGDPIGIILTPSPHSYSHKIENETKTLIMNNAACGYDKTVLSSPHHIQVPVTVHQPMEATT